MELSFLDWGIIIAFFLINLSIGVYVSRKSETSTASFFLSSRNMPWWLLGVSMVATTFSADTPNLVTNIIRENGVSGNWVWWAFLLTGMLTVFVYAQLWRRSKVLTDIEFYELRYSGKEAAFLRGFRAVYLGFFFNIMIMATVCLAAIKISGILLGFSAVQTLLVSSVITVVYSAFGGFRGVIFTDFFQFILAMGATFFAMYYILDLEEIGSLQNLISHPAVSDKLNFIPSFNDSDALITIFIIPIAIQWWNVWYPGAEPGGGGYIAQRMLSAKNEKHAVWATLFFNFAHYALRPWPWIIIALASLIIFPNLSSLQSAFPNVDPNLIGNDSAYPAMMTFLPVGLIGLVIASLTAAFMSTISTHLNWGSSYLVNDFYKRFINPDASEKKMVFVGRLSTVLLMVIAALVALVLSSALEAFQILLSIGAGTGLLFILRWFWYRINAYSEITAMIVSFVVAIYFNLIHDKLGGIPLSDSFKLIAGILITTISWIVVTVLTKPSDEKTLLNFYQKIRPGGRGWKKITDKLSKDNDADYNKDWNIPISIVCMSLASMAVYALLFGIGYFIYDNILWGSFLVFISLSASLIVFKLMKKIFR